MGQSRHTSARTLGIDPAAAVDALLAEYLGTLALPTTLDAAIRYALLGGGKRLRPRLAWVACEAAGGEGADSLPAGAAVELVHAFSLAHDDLPAMDNDDLRRGRPTLHRHAGEAMAILAGDQMLVLAMGVLDRAPAGVRGDLARELVRGTTGMIVGQCYDMGLAETGAGDELARLEAVHRCKTGALIVAACRMGATCAGAGAGVLGSITAFAEAIGLQFQVVDDLLDATASSEDLGKAAGKDAGRGKLTYPVVLGVERSRALAAELGERAIGALGGLGPAAEPLRALARSLAARPA